MTHGSLFSGIGGFDLAAQWMGWENLFHCEISEFGQRILKYYWPDAESFTDIKQTNFKKYANRIDILTGGFPCQPYSLAGQRKCKEDDRHLWPEMLRAIQEIQPKYIVGENVYGLVNWNGGLVFEEVQTDLEDQGYQVQAVILPACSINAPHRRDRVWFVAYSNSNRNITPFKDPEIKRKWSYKDDEQKKRDIKTKRINRSHKFLRSNTCSNSKRLQRGKDKRKIEREGKNRKKQFAGLLGPNWEKFPTKPPIRCGNDGIPKRLDNITVRKWRNESIKAYGNAIVPQVAFEIFKVIQKIENTKQ